MYATIPIEKGNKSSTKPIKKQGKRNQKKRSLTIDHQLRFSFSNNKS